MHDLHGFNRFAGRGHHRLAYELVPAERGGAPVVVLLHGLLAGRGEWAVQRAALAGPRTLLLPEARGHGASAALSDRRFSLGDAAADTLAAIDDAGVGRVHLVGHGLGGATAWEVTRTAPGRVASLTLIEPDLPALLDDALDPQAGSIRRDEQQVARAAADAAYKGLVDQALDAYLSPRLGMDWRARISRPIQATYRRHVAALPALLDAVDAYSPVSIDLPPTLPVLVVHGSSSRLIARLIAERLGASLPHVRLESVPTSSPTDSPLADAAGESLAALVRSFTDEVATSDRGGTAG